MVEQVRDISVVIEVDTNKRTIHEVIEAESLADAANKVDAALATIQEDIV